MPAKALHEEPLSAAQHLQELQEVTGQCLSLYLPVNAAQQGATLFRSRIKAALQKAQKQAAATFGEAAASIWPPPELTSYAQHLRGSSQYGGIAIFSSPETTRVFHAPKMWNEGVHAGNEFYIRPLLSLLMHPSAFYLLCLSKNNVQLRLCTLEGDAEVKLPGRIPDNLDEAMLFKQPDHRLEHGSASGPMPGQERGIRFGTSADDEKHALYLKQFFSQIDTSLREVLTPQPYPLMLAGVKEQLALYSTVNTYEHLMPETIEGNAEWLSSANLYELALKTWQEHQQASEAAILQEINEADSHAKLVKNSLELLPAVEQGRIHHLVLPEQETGDASDELLNHLALEGLRQRSRVSVLAHQPIPGGYAVGVLRYGREAGQREAKAS